MKLGHPGTLFRAPEFAVERNGNWKSTAQEWGHDAVNTVRVWNTNNPGGRNGDSARNIEQPNPLAQRFSHDYWKEKYTNAARMAYFRKHNYHSRTEDEKARIEANYEQLNFASNFPNKITFPANHHALIHTSHFPQPWYSGFEVLGYLAATGALYAFSNQYPLLWFPTVLMGWGSMRMVSDKMIHNNAPSAKSYDWLKNQPWSANAGAKRGETTSLMLSTNQGALGGNK